MAGRLPVLPVRARLVRVAAQALAVAALAGGAAALWRARRRLA